MKASSHLSDELVGIDVDTGSGNLNKRRKTTKSHTRQKTVVSHDRLRPDETQYVTEESCYNSTCTSVSQLFSYQVRYIFRMPLE